MVLCNVVDDKTDHPVEIAPLSLLLKQIERAAEMGFTAKAGSD